MDLLINCRPICALSGENNPELVSVELMCSCGLPILLYMQLRACGLVMGPLYEAILKHV